MENQIIAFAKQHITKQYADLHQLQSFFDESKNENVDWAYIFQKLYIHACLHGHRETAKWLREIFEQKADPLTQIAYRQTYAYANVLLKKKGKEPL